MEYEKNIFLHTKNIFSLPENNISIYEMTSSKEVFHSPGLLTHPAGRLQLKGSNFSGFTSTEKLDPNSKILHWLYVDCKCITMSEAWEVITFYYKGKKHMKQTILMIIVTGLLAIGLGGCNDSSSTQEGESVKDTTVSPVTTGEGDSVTTSDQSQAQAYEITEKSSGSSGVVNDTTGQLREENVMSGNTLQEQLQNRRFLFKNIDGVAPSNNEKILDLEFGDGFRAFGAICNRFTGQAEVDGDTLFIKQMASTKMLCFDSDLNSLEATFGEMMMGGVQVEFDGKTLLLKSAEHTITYELQEPTQ